VCIIELDVNLDIPFKVDLIFPLFIFRYTNCIHYIASNRTVVNYELGIIWKEAAVARFLRHGLKIVLERLKKTTKTLLQ
jgi:hypothetical protein